ncbi:threonine--tRNA ligase [Candidatus Woesearchaeota archaeon]|nr:threonine--tRNA ligase [Candidatus Woesearchaeota archaeon]
MIKITFPDKTVKEFEKGVTAYDVALSIGEGLARAALAAKVDGALVDMNTKIKKDSVFAVVTFKDDEGKKVFWHSSSHLMAAAVKKVYPDAIPTMGPAVDDGFYYDFDSPQSFSEDDFEKIEIEMNKLVDQKQEFIRKEVSVEEALEIFKDNKYKQEIVKDNADVVVSVYTNGDFTDLCRGPHVPNTSYLKAVKLTKVAGAYWKGDAKNKMLQRLYGISFPDKKELRAHVRMLEEAAKRDHRKIGTQMDLFSFHEEGPGFPFFHPKGMVIINELMNFWNRLHRDDGYSVVRTPVILARTLWEQSGHWDNYKNNMYFTKIDDIDYAIKPMNCPGGILIFKSRKHSYKEFPIKMGEFGLVHRHELSGVLAGLFRVRSFTQDDAHIFMLPEQIPKQIKGVINLVDRIYKEFGFEYKVELSTRPDKSIGSDEMWSQAEGSLKKVLDEMKMEYRINEGDGAFYGPKIDFHIKDCVGRTWQCGTIQLDFAMPEKFDLQYMGEDGTEEHRPVMIHRTIYGSLERFMGILVEHYAGKFPLWLSPEQVRVLTVADRFADYAEEVKTKLFKQGFRVTADYRSETVNKKIREAQLDKVNYILVVGEKEQQNSSINVRTRDGQVHGEIAVDKFIEDLKKESEK